MACVTPLSHWPVDVLLSVLAWIPDQSIDACLLKQTCQWIKLLLTQHLKRSPIVSPRLAASHDLSVVLRYLPEVTNKARLSLQLMSLKHDRFDNFKHLFIPKDVNSLFVLTPAQHGHLECLKSVLALYEPMTADWMETHALSRACLHGRLEIVQYLHSIGTNIREDDDNALMLASRAGHLKVVKFLHSKAADIHSKSDDAFIAACKNGHLDVAIYLYTAGVSVAAFGVRAVMEASSHGHLKIVKFLHSLNVNLNEAMILQMASCGGHIEVVKYAHKFGGNVHLQGNYAIRMACGNGHLEVVQFLHSIGADIHIHNESPMHEAVKNGHLEVVKFLHSVGADIHFRNDDGLRIALNYGSNEGHLAVARYLFENGVTQHVQEVINEHCEGCGVPILKFLHSIGADLHLNLAQNMTITTDLPTLRYLKSLLFLDNM